LFRKVRSGILAAVLKTRTIETRHWLLATALLGGIGGATVMPRTSFAQVRHGQLIIVSEPSGAQVSIDGRLIGTAPVTVPDLLPGDHLVTIVASNGSRAEQIATVAAGESRVVRISVGAPPVNPAPTAPSSQPVPQPAPATPAPNANLTEPTNAAPPSTGTTVPLGTVAVLSSESTPPSPTPPAPAPDAVTQPGPPIANPSLFTTAGPALTLHRETEPLDADVAPVSAHMSLGAGVDLMYYGSVARLENTGRDGTAARIRIDTMLTRVVGVQILMYTPAISFGAGVILGYPTISIGSRVGISPRFTINFMGGPNVLFMNTDLETRVSIALVRHLSLFAGLGGSMALAVGFVRTAPDAYGYSFTREAAGLYLGFYGSGGVQWVF
jgi:hypothetical protein